MLLPSILLMLTPAAQNAGDQPNSTDDQKIVCRMEIVTGSQIKARVCRTQAQWKQIAADTEKEIQQATSMPAVSCSPNPFGGC